MQYIVNALMANYSKRRGGYQGLKLNDKKQVLETAMANIALITRDGIFVAVPPEHILEGTTIKRVMGFVR
jgi:4-amino-4-deoxychorismate lyase